MREKSLKVDKNDFNAFRDGRRKHMGTCISSEFYQPIPFFFTREKMPLHLVGQYRGWPAFLICNGPSIVNGKYDLSLLKHPGIMTYGVNNGPRTIRPNFWTCVDDPRRFIKSIWLDPQITKFIPHAFHDKPLWDNEKWEELSFGGRKIVVGDCPNVVYFHRNEKFVADRFLFEDTLNWGNHADFGGGRSVMLPAIRILFLLGFRKVYLMGADFKMTTDYTYHFDEQRQNGAVKCNMSTYDRLKEEYFPSIKPYFDAEGFQVFNCNPDSELKVFPFKDYNEAIQESISVIGDIMNERTYGMYTKPEEREKWKIDPTRDEKKKLSNMTNSSPVCSHPSLVPFVKPEQKQELKVKLPTVQPVVQEEQADQEVNEDRKLTLSVFDSISGSKVGNKVPTEQNEQICVSPMKLQVFEDKGDEDNNVEQKAKEVKVFEPVEKIINEEHEDDEEEGNKDFERWDELEAVSRKGISTVPIPMPNISPKMTEQPKSVPKIQNMSKIPNMPNMVDIPSVPNIPTSFIMNKESIPNMTYPIPQPVIRKIDNTVKEKVIASMPTLKAIRTVKP